MSIGSMRTHCNLVLIVSLSLFYSRLSYSASKTLSKSALYAATFSSPLRPTHHSQQLMKHLTNVAKFSLPVFASTVLPQSALASLQPTGALGQSAYTTLGNLNMCRVLNGMWQVSGAHGYSPIRSNVVAKMTEYADKGFTTFDLADIYGPAEDFVGAFSKGLESSSISRDCQFFTKWVPQVPSELDRKFVEAAIDKSLYRMKREAIDLLQFHWWEYDNHYYLEAIDGLMHLQQMDKILNIGLTNFDTEHLQILMDQDAPIVSNQVSYSVLDTRPAELMEKLCLERDVKLLCYGSLLGGFISPYWLGKTEPGQYSGSSAKELSNVSLRKYFPWIELWGGWNLFQELLRVLEEIGKKYGVSLSNVAVRWVLEQPAVGGAIIGARFGFTDHLKDNAAVFSFVLDEDDKAKIKAVQAKARNGGKALFNRYGDCGSEYRPRRKRARA